MKQANDTIYDFQADDFYNVIVKNGISSSRATRFIRLYIFSRGLLNGKKIKKKSTPMFDYQLNDLCKCMVKSGLSKKRAANIVLAYKSKYGVRDSDSYFIELFKKALNCNKSIEL